MIQQWIINICSNLPVYVLFIIVGVFTVLCFTVALLFNDSETRKLEQRK